MDPQKFSEKDKAGTPVSTLEKGKTVNSFPPEVASDLSLSEEPAKPVAVVAGTQSPTSEPSKPPVSSESYSPLGTITPLSAPDTPAPQAQGRKKKWGLIGLIILVVLVLSVATVVYLG